MCVMNISEKHASLIVKNGFWADVFKAWCKLTYQDASGKAQALDQSLWYNSNITINNQLICNMAALRSGIVKVSDITQEDGKFRSYHEVHVDSDGTVSFLQ